MRPMNRHVSPATLCILCFACGGEERAPNSPSGARPAAIVVVSGDNQQSKTNEPLDEPFVVHVIDTRGGGVPQVNVRFTVESGDGAWRWDEDGAVKVSVVPTDNNGLARARFTPLVLGTSTVKARLEGRQNLSVTLSTSATTEVIHFILWNWGFFTRADVTVPVGTPVEWAQTYSRAKYTVTSSAAPPGGPSFDSGVLEADERFEFVPMVAGTWEYFDQLSGAKGTLIVR